MVYNIIPSTVYIIIFPDTTLGKTSAGSKKSAIEIGVVAGGIIASIIFLLLVVVAFVLVRRRSRKKQREESVKVNLIFDHFNYWW